MFADCELIGIPYRVVISDRGLDDGSVELKARRGDVVDKVPIDEIAGRVRERIEADLRGS
jgi:prolyl-tRNA synthetase